MAQENAQDVMMNKIAVIAKIIMDAQMMLYPAFKMPVLTVKLIAKMQRK